MICIAYNHHGQPISIVNAKNEELAMAYWQGAGVLPFSHKTEDDFDFNINGTGVVPILKTVERDVYTLNRDLGNKILTILKS